MLPAECNTNAHSSQARIRRPTRPIHLSKCFTTLQHSVHALLCRDWPCLHGWPRGRSDAEAKDLTQTGHARNTSHTAAQGRGSQGPRASRPHPSLPILGSLAQSRDGSHCEVDAAPAEKLTSLCCTLNAASGISCVGSCERKIKSLPFRPRQQGSSTA